MKAAGTRKSIKMFAVSISLLLGLAMAQFPQASAAVGCSGKGCNGKNPYTTGCNKNSFVYHRYTPQDRKSGYLIRATVEVHYSRSCGTNWILVDRNPYGGETYKSIMSLNKNKSVIYWEQEKDKGYGYSYSMMVYAPGSTMIEVYVRLFDKSHNLKASAGVYALK